MKSQAKLKVLVSIAILCLFIFAALACSPKAQPTIVPTPTPTAALSPDEAAWAKVVAAAKTESKVTTYGSGWGTVPRALAGPFKEKYGITLEDVPGNASSAAQKIITEQAAKAYVADILEGGPGTPRLLKKSGFLETSRDLPVFREKVEWRQWPFYDPEGYLIIHRGFPPLAPFYNAQLVKPEDVPTSWRDLLDPKWKGKLVADRPWQMSGSSLELGALLSKGILDKDYMQKLAEQGITFVPTPGDVIDRLARGEFPIGVAVDGIRALPKIKGGVPLKPIVMKEGLARPLTTIQMVKNAPHPNASKVFLNWLLSKEGQTIMAKELGESGIRADIEDFLPTELKYSGVPIFNIDTDGMTFIETWISEGTAAKLFQK